MSRLPVLLSPARLPPAALLLLIAAIWGSSYSVVKTALSWYPVAGVIAIRFLLTALLLAPYWLRLPAAQRRLTLAVAAPTSLGLLAIFFAETAGVAHTSAGNAAFLVSLCLLLTPPMEWAWFGRRPAAKLWLAALVSLLGTWLLTGLAAGGLNGGDDEADEHVFRVIMPNNSRTTTTPTQAIFRSLDEVFVAP